jgi:Fe-S cluster assembly protein SufD
MNSLKDKLVQDFAVLETSINGKSQSTLHAERKQAIKEFETLGFPTLKNEEWKYTSVAELQKNTFDVLSNTSKLSKADVEKHFIPELKANNLVFINGAFKKDLSNIISPESELSIKNLSDIIYSPEFDQIKKSFGQHKKYNNDGFIAMNDAFTSNGVLMEVPANKIVSAPVAIYFFADSQSGNSISIPQIYIKASKSSEIHIIEHYVNAGSNVSFTNVLTEFIVEENANVSYYKIQNEGAQTYHVGNTQVNQVGKSVFNAVTISLTGDMVRNNLNITLQKEYSETHLFGLSLLNGDTHVDNHTVVDHAVANCESNELYKAVLDDSSTSVFNGKIFVRPDAQKTNAYQSSKNILLSNDATSNSKPQLEIWADDVKCSHGHATGQLDKEALFYLKARGIGDNEAKAMLTQAFAQDVLNAIRIEPLKAYCEKQVAGRF